MDEILIPRHLFGGAMDLSLPARFVDVSDFRPVPDNQEVRDICNIIVFLNLRRHNKRCWRFAGVYRRQPGPVSNRRICSKRTSVLWTRRNSPTLFPRKFQHPYVTIHCLFLSNRITILWGMKRLESFSGTT